ncbi:MAG: lipid A biosynthesis lauroyl acyltransferase [Arcobacter sp.]|uniref:lipid A biosynthesis lauroyl acyltransferase n=1 Tax=Arcobacter sp. TaxID=1872629 RepID=UPI003AFFC153
MKENILYFILITIIKFLAILPRFLRKRFFFFLSKLVYFFAKKTNKIIKANLDLVFDKKMLKEEIQKIQKYSYYNMLLWIQSQIEHLNVTEDEMRKKITFENREIFDNLLREEKKIILVSAHYGNIEVLSYGINKFITPLIQVARESNFKKIDAFIKKSREKSGATIIYRALALKKLIKALMNNKVISLIVDQNINDRDGIEVSFLNKKANQTTTPAILARKFNAYILPVAIFNEDKDKYKIKIYEPIKPIKTENEQEDIKNSTQLQADILSKIILEDPKQWFWAHKRFKMHFREIYE